MTWWLPSQFLLKLALVTTVALCRYYRPPRPPTPFDNCTHAVIALSSFWSILISLHELVSDAVDLGALRDLVTNPQIVFANHFNMVMTLVAFLWMVFRAVQTLRLPTRLLVQNLEFNVPETPEVSLTGIKSDSAELRWSSPKNPKSVHKYNIQVNGFKVGEVGVQETAITVTGLKSGHFYNIRVIAVGFNNYKVPSAVIRLQTYDRDGRPIVSNTILRTPQVESELVPHPSTPGERLKAIVTPIEPAPTPTPGSTQDVHAPGQRRNTINRKAPPPIANIEPALPSESETAPVLTQLNEEFERIRAEFDETTVANGREEAEFKQQEAQIKEQIADKRQRLRDREAKTEQLKRSLRTITEATGQIRKEKAKKEQAINDKMASIERSRAAIKKLQTGAKDFQTKRESYEKERKQLLAEHEAEMLRLEAEISELITTCKTLEATLKAKGQTIMDLKAQQPTEEQAKMDAAHMEREQEEVQTLEMENQRLQEQVQIISSRRHDLQRQYDSLKVYSENYSVPSMGMIQALNGQYYPNGLGNGLGNGLSNGLNNGQTVSDMEQSMMGANSQSLQQTPVHSVVNTAATGSMAYSSMDPYNGLSAYHPGNAFAYTEAMGGYPDEALELGGDLHREPTPASLSPNARNLLPSGILADSEDISDAEGPPLLPPPMDDAHTPPQTASHSPSQLAQQTTSPPVFPSPHGSTHNLLFGNRGTETPNRLTTTISRETTHSIGSGSTHIHHSPYTRLADIFSLPRGRNKHTGETEFGPALGSLKSSQTQSLPRTTDGALAEARPKRSAFGLFNRGTMPLGSDVRSTFTPTGSSALGGVPDRDPSSPRPASITSLEIVRPSTESGPWRSDGRGGTVGRMYANDLWSSRNPSRRTSLHGGNSNGGSPFASVDDPFLHSADVNDGNPARRLGAIGSKLPHAQSMSPGGTVRLNPKAPTFLATGPRGDNGQMTEENGSVFSTDDFGYGSDGDDYDTLIDDSPNEVRKTSSQRTLDSLDENQSDHSLRKLFRKGNSSRFSLTRLNKRASVDSEAGGEDEVVTSPDATGKSSKVWRLSMGGRKKERVREGEDSEAAT